MPYAANGQISQSPIEGGIEITHAQYDEALAGMLQGRVVSIEDGFAVNDPPAPEPEPEPGPEPEPEPEPEPPTLEEAIAAKLAELDDFRWQVEIGGAVFNGAFIRTDANSQAKITAVYTMARLDPEYEVPVWEVVPGVFMPLDNATIIAMGEAVRDHVQGTFNHKAVLHGQIAALASVEAVEAFDIATEWNTVS